MADTPSLVPRATARLARYLEVLLCRADGSQRALGPPAHTINISEHGLLMIIPESLDAVVGQEVEVLLRWSDGSFRTAGEIVRFESPYWMDGRSSVMGIHLRRPLPADLLVDPVR